MAFSLPDRDPTDGSDADGLPDEWDEERIDSEFPLGDGVADIEGMVYCPYCGEPNEIALDPGGGTVQEYVEDCGVCCQPWRLSVVYHEDGSADITATTADGE